MNVIRDLILLNLYTAKVEADRENADRIVRALEDSKKEEPIPLYVVPTKDLE